jgi:hypothetical protein
LYTRELLSENVSTLLTKPRLAALRLYTGIVPPPPPGRFAFDGPGMLNS